MLLFGDGAQQAESSRGPDADQAP